VAQHLNTRDVEFFLPQYKEKRRWTDRTVEIDAPLFPCYLFVRISLYDRLRVLETPGVIRLVGASGRPEPLEDEEIERMRNICANQHTLKPLPHTVDGLNAGDRVRVVRGPLTGYCGYLSRTKKGRVVLVQELTQQAVSVEVEMDAVMPMPEAQKMPGATRGERVSREGLEGRSASVGASEMVSEKPHTFARTETHAGGGGVEVAVGAASAPEPQRMRDGDPCLGDVVPGICPPKVPASSVGTPKRSLSGD
jgi:transcription antitermination factor NusG